MKIGYKIKELRKKFNYTQSELSELSGLSIRTIQRLENNEVSPSSYTLKVLSDIFNFNLFKIKLNSIVTDWKQRIYWGLFLVVGIPFLTYLYFGHYNIESFLFQFCIILLMYSSGLIIEQYIIKKRN